MPAFILRYAGTKDFAGFYTAETEDDLFDLIDEETDPGDYEYAVVRRGYGIELRKGEWPIRCKLGRGEKALYAAFSKANSIYMTWALLDAMADGTDLVWRQLYED